MLAGGTCGTSGTAALFSYSPGAGWQRLSLPVAGQLVRLTGGMALVRGKSGLSALWRGFGWYAYAPLFEHAAARPDGLGQVRVAAAAWPAITASGTLRPGGAWVLLSGGRAATISVRATPGAAAVAAAAAGAGAAPRCSPPGRTAPPTPSRCPGPR